jgi:hypothetical protein
MRTRTNALLLVGLAAIAACRAAPTARSASTSAGIVPVLRDGSYVFSRGDLSFVIDPRIGARVTSFALGGHEMLSGPEVNALNFGSTFWTSPQSDWGWPPPAAIDRDPYEARLEGDTLVLRSAPCAALGVVVTKKIRADAADGSVTITYVIENHGDAPRRFAPWEVTRMPATGVTFFPTGSATYGSGPFRPLAGVREASGHTWFALDPSAARGDEQELFADGAGGFVAHAEGDRVLVRVFDDVPPAARAPDEGEIEIFLRADPDPRARYMELEVQGAYVSVPPGGASSWRTTWYLRRLPPGARAVVGDAALVAAVAAIARR